MSGEAPAQQGPQRGCCMECVCDAYSVVVNINQLSLNKVRCYLTIVNVFAGAMLTLAAVVSLMTAIFALTRALTAVYVILFSFLLCVFEMHLSFLDRMFFLNLGFMFTRSGRLLFFAFIGSLACALAEIGYMAAVVTFLAVLFNLWVFTKHDKFKIWQMQQNAKHMNGILGKETARMEKIERDGGPGEEDWAAEVGLDHGEMNDVAKKAQNAKKGAEFAASHQDEMAAAAKFAQENPETAKKMGKMAQDNPDMAKAVVQAGT